MDKEDFLKAKEDYIGLFMQSQADKINIYVEGKDDYDFYYQFFKSKCPNLIKCFDKKNVLKVANIHNKIGCYKSIFFVDRDFDENEEIENVFCTDFYNFESHVFSRENIETYLKHKHSLKDEDIKNITEFLNSERVLKMFHTEYERIKVHDGISENKFINGNLNSIDIDSNYNFSDENLFTQKVLPSISTDTLDSIEMYNGKFIGNLIYGIFRKDWFKSKFKFDMRKFERQKLTLEMIINSKEPQYVKNAIDSLATK